MIYVGIDPGNNGAIVGIDESYRTVAAECMPLIDIGKGKKHKWVLDKVAVLRVLKDLSYLSQPGPDVLLRNLFVVLEKAQVMGGAGGRSPASPRAMFQYGRGFGGWEMALMALEIPHAVVHPRTWGKVLSGIEGSDSKARAILKCQRALPTLDLTPGRKRKPHDGLADAGCMALHAMTLRPVPGLVIPTPPSVRQSIAPLPPPPPLRR